MNTDDTIFHYPNLTKIPETDFTCDGRKGMFADVETNCQVRVYIKYMLYIFLYFLFQIFYFYYIHFIL